MSQKIIENFTFKDILRYHQKRKENKKHEEKSTFFGFSGLAFSFL